MSVHYRKDRPDLHRIQKLKSRVDFGTVTGITQGEGVLLGLAGTTTSGFEFTSELKQRG